MGFRLWFGLELKVLKFRLSSLTVHSGRGSNGEDKPQVVSSWKPGRTRGRRRKLSAKEKNSLAAIQA